jgi:site-specific DNA-methyltransferase (adenine-specific)
MPAERNRTLTLNQDDDYLGGRLLKLSSMAALPQVLNRTINQDLNDCVDWLPDSFVDVLFLDPPYNLNKTFGAETFKKLSDDEYQIWVESWLTKFLRLLKSTASIYVCCDWQSSPLLYAILNKHFVVRNRITWEREKGRGAKSNWKNCSEDIWFATVSDNYCFNVDAVKLKRRVIAPYRQHDGSPKDWQDERDGNYRLTHPSNLWTDITVPFWSMPENTNHPTQKPEKLLAKIILASSQENDVIFDPFLGSGTTSVVAKKLRRNYCGIEVDQSYAMLAEKRLALAETNKAIQGYSNGVFWERNSLNNQQQQLSAENQRANFMERLL